MKQKVYPKTISGKDVKLIDEVYYLGVIQEIFNYTKFTYNSKDLDKVIDNIKFVYNQHLWKLKFKYLYLSQIPTLCGGGLIEGINNIVHCKDDEIKTNLTDLLEYVLHCRNCYQIQHNGEDKEDYPTYYNEEFNNLPRAKMIGELYASKDSLFGFSYLTCNLAIDDEYDEDDKIDLKNRQKYYDLADILKSLGFKLSNTTTNIKTSNKILHFTLNIKDYVKTKQPAKSIKSKKTQVATTI